MIIGQRIYTEYISIYLYCLAETNSLDNKSIVHLTVIFLRPAVGAGIISETQINHDYVQVLSKNNANITPKERAHKTKKEK